MRVLVCRSRTTESRDALRRAFAARGLLGPRLRVGRGGGGPRWRPTTSTATPRRGRDAADGDPPARPCRDGAKAPAAARLRARRPTSRLETAVDADGARRATTSSGGRSRRRASRSSATRRSAAGRARQAAEDTRVRLARAELRDALPGRSPRWIAALASLERAAASERLRPPDGGDRHGEGRRRAGPPPALRPRRGPVRVHLGRRVARPGHAADRHGTLFLESVEATSAGFQEHAACAHIGGRGTSASSSRSTRTPRDALRAGVSCRRLATTSPPTRSTFRRCASARATCRCWRGASSRTGAGPLPRRSRPPTPWPRTTGRATRTSCARTRSARASRLLRGDDRPDRRPVGPRPAILAERARRRPKAPVVHIAVGDSLADVERRLISKTLEFARGNKKKTAELLKLSLKTIYNKIKEYGLEH